MNANAPATRGSSSNNINIVYMENSGTRETTRAISRHILLTTWSFVQQLTQARNKPPKLCMTGLSAENPSPPRESPHKEPCAGLVVQASLHQNDTLGQGWYMSSKVFHYLNMLMTNNLFTSTD